jgi:hypothetical protein
MRFVTITIEFEHDGLLFDEVILGGFKEMAREWAENQAVHITLHSASIQADDSDDDDEE